MLLAGRLTMANGGTIKPRGSRLRDETPALRDPWLVLSGLNIRGDQRRDPHDNGVLVPAGT